VDERGTVAPLGGGERFFSTSSHVSGNINVDAPTSAPAGIYATVERLANGTYRITC
jgi:hypothetical protein